MDDQMLPPLPSSSPRHTMKTPTPSKTPKKRTASVREAWSDVEDGDNISVKKVKPSPKSATSTPRKRKAPSKDPLHSQPMGKAYELCSEQDKMLLDWKDAGRTWEDIRKKWHEMTGDKTAQSTLPNRYSRLKSNFVVIKEEDNAILLEAKQEVEASFESEKWTLISKAMEAKGADSYGTAELRRQYKKLLEFGRELKAQREGLIQPAVATPAKSAMKKGKTAVRNKGYGGDEMDED